jgi:hypothetical protein
MQRYAHLNSETLLDEVNEVVKLSDLAGKEERSASTSEKKGSKFYIPASSSYLVQGIDE